MMHSTKLAEVSVSSFILYCAYYPPGLIPLLWEIPESGGA